MAFRAKYMAIKVSKGLKYAVFATNIIAIILLLLSIKASTTPPSAMMFIAYLGMGFPILLVVNILYLILWILFFRWKYVLVQLVALVICWNDIYTYIPFNSQEDEIPEDCIKIMTYNVRGFDWLTGKEARENPVLEYIANSGADIICLQEFALDDKKGRNRLVSVKEFDDIMKEYPYRAIVKLGPENEPHIYGLACYSKYPILKQARLPIRSAFNGAAMYEIRIGRKNIIVVNNHLESNRITAEDKVLYKELVVNGNREVIGDLAENVQNRLEPAFKTREYQADIIARCIKEQRDNVKGMIICGDFNDPPLSYTYQTIKGSFTDSYKETGRGVGITYHADGFWFRIDYIMHSKNIKSYNCVVDRVKYSDHYPVFSYISLAGL